MIEKVEAQVSDPKGPTPATLLAADDVLPQLTAWQREGQRVCLVTVVGIEGAGPRPVGAQMAVAEDGRFVGYLSGGCLEQAVALEAKAAIKAGANRLVRYGRGSPYFDVKLPCGSGLDLYFDQGLDPRLLDALETMRVRREPAALRTDLATGLSSLAGIPAGGVDARLVGRCEHFAKSDSAGAAASDIAETLSPTYAVASASVGEAAGNSVARPRLGALGASALAGDAGVAGGGQAQPAAQTRVGALPANHRDGDVFTRVILPPVRLLLIGSGPAVGAIARLVALVGFAIEVLSPDGGTLKEVREAGIAASELTRPGLGASVAPDAATAVVLAFHEHDWEPPILEAVLRSPAFYIGALGNRTVHAARLATLSAKGFGAEDVARVKGPIGLIAGAKSRATLGLGVVAEVAAEAKASGLIW